MARASQFLEYDGQQRGLAPVRCPGLERVRDVEQPGPAEPGEPGEPNGPDEHKRAVPRSDSTRFIRSPPSGDRLED